jgi:nucleotidyltransferase/DNA polymerase involved in DNA repair
MSPRVIAHLDMDAFFAAVEQRDTPGLKGKPVVVGADPKGGRGRGVVSTCSYEARRCGIHSAMPISAAYRCCPGAVFLPVDMRKYSKVSRAMFAILYDFTPEIEPLSIDEAFLDITGSIRLFGGPLEMAAKIKERVKKDLCLAATIGIAPNKMAAKIASARAKPDGLLEVTADGLLSFLWPLPVSKMFGVGEQTEKVLVAMGIQTIGDLAQRPVSSLVERLGVRGQDLWDLANGHDARVVVPEGDAKSVSHEHTFEEDTADREQLDTVLSALCEKVSRRLRADGFKGRTVTLKLRSGEFKTITRDVTLPERTNFFDTIYAASRLLLGAACVPGKKYRLIGVRVSNFHQPYVRDSLFEAVASRKAEKIHRAVDAIKAKFGEKGIVRARSF